MIEWILNNKSWLFSGIAVAIPIAIAGWLITRPANKQVQKSGKNSKNLQAGGDIIIKGKSDD